MELHEFLDRWRAGRGWTIQRLADELEVSQSLVSKWLHPDARRRVRPNRVTVRRLADLMGVPRLELMRMARYVDDADLDHAEPFDADLVFVKAAWPRLSEWRQKAIKALAEVGGGGLIDTYVPLLARG